MVTQPDLNATAQINHPSAHAVTTPDKPAVIAATSGAITTYAELDRRSNQVAALLTARGLVTGDGIAVLMANGTEWFDVVWGAMRAGLYVTPINWHLTAHEAAYIINDCEAKALFADASLADTVARLVDTPTAALRLSTGGELAGFEPLAAAVARQPTTAREGQREGMWMFYSSGTTGVPKGIKPTLPAPELGGPNAFTMLLVGLYGFGPDVVYLCPAPLYHAAPAGWSTGTHRLGGTVVVMDRFDPIEFLALIEKHRVTHVQVVPTHLIRLLKLAERDRARFDLSSLKVLVHAAAPCPASVKREVIDWLGPIVYEYYSASEGSGFTAITSQEWLAHPGSVGRSMLGAVHIVGPDGGELPVGEEGQIWFESASQFAYHGDPAKTAQAFNSAGWSTIGDVGRVDADGYLYLTDRASNMIISGGVNIYPREAEDVLVVHPSVEDVAVIGTPEEEMGERVTAFIQLREGIAPSDALADELISYCRERLSTFKCPREIRFVDELPRLPNGKLLKRLLTQPES
ncbi:MAG TPA: acyl-CoA synthetase [Mycobacteriales bacterium]|nr:acyl-CoA synthetase [Mycobacteriales bacterium]